MTEYAPIIKGFCIAVLLAAIGLKIDMPSWWVSMLALNIALNI